MSQNTTNSTAFIHAEQFSELILANLKDGLLPTVFYRNVTDFGEGQTLDIKTIGTATVQDVTEDTPLTYNPIDTGIVQLQITEYIGDAWFVTDVLRQDGHQIDQLLAMRGIEATRAIQENFETVWLQTLNDGQTAANANAVNGFTHRFVGTGAGETITIADFNTMRLSFDKANVPMAGRVAIVDPVVAASLNRAFQTTNAVDSNPTMQAILEDGFDRDHRFVINLFGWDIWTSNRLADIVSEQIGGAGATVTGGKANLFFSMLDDQTKPGMVAWRQLPKVEGERNKDRQRDEFLTTARWGVGVQRLDTLGVILTDAQNV